MFFRLGVYSDAKREFEAKKDSYVKMQDEIKNCKMTSDKLMRSLTIRQVRVIEFRKLLAIRCRTAFGHYLKNRDFIGKLKFDHEKEKLKILAQPNKANGYKGTLQLSGGERSYTTVCFLLSLWTAMNCPFSILDEFDVFMDSVNRHISTKLIIETARMQSHRQFILISPQDMA